MIILKEGGGHLDTIGPWTVPYMIRDPVDPVNPSGYAINWYVLASRHMTTPMTFDNAYD